MKVLNKNIKINAPFKSYEWSWIFFTFFFTSSIFLGISKPNFEKQETVSYSYKANQGDTHAAFTQDFKPVQQTNVLFIYDLVEESETIDENTEGSAIISAYPLYILASLVHNILKSSFANFNLALQKRTSIPIFLLHHSWRLPFAY